MTEAVAFYPNFEGEYRFVIDPQLRTTVFAEALEVDVSKSSHRALAQAAGLPNYRGGLFIVKENEYQYSNGCSENRSAERSDFVEALSRGLVWLGA